MLVLAPSPGAVRGDLRGQVGLEPSTVSAARRLLGVVAPWVVTCRGWRGKEATNPPLPLSAGSETCLMLKMVLSLDPNPQASRVLCTLLATRWRCCLSLS